MTDEPLDIDAAVAICDAATPGPWQYYARGRNGPQYVHAVYDADNAVVSAISANRQFIAAARTGWPATLKELADTREHLATAELLRQEDVADSVKRQHIAELERDELQVRLDAVLAICNNQDYSSLVTKHSIRRAASSPEANR